MQLQNELLDMKGKVRAVIRIRPPVQIKYCQAMLDWKIDGSALEISTVDNVKHLFNFEQIFHPQSSQSDVFAIVAPLIQSAFDGFDVNIIAYGQTGSGETFTMEGTPQKTGIIANTIEWAFSKVENYKLLGWSYEISVAFLEIYNEVIYDLLSNDLKEMEIQMVDPTTPHGIIVPNLTEITVKSAAELHELIEESKSNRATAAAVDKDRSLRSHAVTQNKLTGIHIGRRETCVGKINLIDLAGSESPNTSSRIDETKNINRSLSELKNVTRALLKQFDYIPYDDSKLTHLLMPSLTGNSKTLMFVNVVPFEDCFEESFKSLRFAADVNDWNKMRKFCSLV